MVWVGVGGWGDHCNNYVLHRVPSLIHPPTILHWRYSPPRSALAWRLLLPSHEHLRPPHPQHKHMHTQATPTVLRWRYSSLRSALACRLTSSRHTHTRSATTGPAWAAAACECGVGGVGGGGGRIGTPPSVPLHCNASECRSDRWQQWHPAGSCSQQGAAARRCGCARGAGRSASQLAHLQALQRLVVRVVLGRISPVLQDVASGGGGGEAGCLGPATNGEGVRGSRAQPRRTTDSWAYARNCSSSAWATLAASVAIAISHNRRRRSCHCCQCASPLLSLVLRATARPL